jgi:hypothetical protein
VSPDALGKSNDSMCTDLVDEAASALRLAQESKPDELEALDRDMITLQVCSFNYTRSITRAISLTD